MWFEDYEKRLQGAKGDSFTLCLIINEASDDKQLDDFDFNLLYEEAVNLGL